MLTDLPYLEPLLFWLRQDPELKTIFTEKSYFMPHDDMINAVMEAIKKDCPAPRVIWILPQQTIATATNPNCKSPGRHTFYIQIFVQCIRDKFQISKKDNKIQLTGQFMELTKIRNEVKRSVNDFSKSQNNLPIKKFDNIRWVGDSMLYPESEGGHQSFLITNLEYEVTLYV